MRTSASFPFYASDFIMGCMMFSAEETGAYIRLLCYQWEQGFIPNNPEKIKKISGISSKKISAVMEKFQLSDGKFINSKMEHVRSEREAFIDIQRQNGKKGGRPRKNHDEESKPMGNPTLSNGLTQTKPEITLPSPSPSPSPIPPNPQGEREEAFEKFWKSYPKKKAKGDAEKAWKKINLADLSVILSAIEEQKQSHDWQKEFGQFIPLPASWLNAKRWKDETEGELIPQARQVVATGFGFQYADQ